MISSFLYNYLRSMRLYYCFITGTTVLFGIVWMQGRGAAHFEGWRCIVLLCVGFLAWGVNQIFSDYCDRKEDAVNAPHRPMVTGALKPVAAMMLSGAFLVLFGVASCFMTPWTLVALAVGGMSNILYSCLKRLPVVNFLVYACAITCCAVYGATGAAGRMPEWRTVVIISLYVLPAHLFMCHNSYYKDVAGDRAAGVRTLQTLLPETVSICLTCLEFVYAVVLCEACGGFRNMLQTGQLLLEISLLAHLVNNITRKRYHCATFVNCQLCMAMMYPVLLAYRPCFMLAELASFLVVQLLSWWYDDEKE